ncbi:hypothetical protein [Priestia flexa]|uniref:hypothetical protein n=1 Tax=Priestia flexa TaxID=86664 RepID=UPI001C939616|nr:hypothetical protein [Priestia flexa]MBY6088505.1 hypothetical protein [Priestia flexa]
MTNKTNFISLYKICEELFVEKVQEEKKILGEDFDEKSFQNYYNKKKSNFKEIITSLGIDTDVLKKVDDDSFEIPVRNKEIVKKLLHNYTSKTMKKVRKKEFTDISSEELEQVIKDVESLMDGKVTGEQYELERNRMYFLTRYPITKTIAGLKEELVNQMVLDMEKMIPVVTEVPDDTFIIEHALNDEDRLHLLHYYKCRLQDVQEEMKSVVQYLSDYRTDEILDISADMIKQEGDVEENFRQQELDLDESWEIIFEAAQSYRDERFKNKLRKLNRPTPEELEEVKKIWRKESDSSLCTRVFFRLLRNFVLNSFFMSVFFYQW